MSSITAAVIVMIASAGLWIGTVFLSLTYNKGGHAPVRALYSVSQWDPARVTLTGSCVIPPIPGQCVIEGEAAAYQDATHWCQSSSGVCIDPNTGENVKDNPIPFKVACAEVPYCGWSQCRITFDGKIYVLVKDGVLTYTSLDLATPFYMERLAVDQGLVLNQNGTIARFYYFDTDGTRYVLSYTNSWLVPTTNERVTKLTLSKTSATVTALLDFFVLIEALPTTLANIPNGVVPRKILVFGGVNRTTNPGLDVLQDFNDHSAGSLWKALQKYELDVINWSTVPDTNAGYFALDHPNYVDVLNSFHSGPTANPNFALQQDIVESRLRGEVGGGMGRKFYNLLG